MTWSSWSSPYRYLNELTCYKQIEQLQSLAWALIIVVLNVVSNIVQNQLRVCIYIYIVIFTPPNSYQHPFFCKSIGSLVCTIVHNTVWCGDPVVHCKNAQLKLNPNNGRFKFTWGLDWILSVHFHNGQPDVLHSTVPCSWTPLPMCIM